MDANTSLKEITTWHKLLGLLPIPLFDNSNEGQYILLNGSQGNFCLNIQEETKPGIDNARNYAWSSNVGHYVSLVGNTVEVQRWDQFSSTFERYSLKSISSNLEKFHQYLEINSPKQDFSVIAHSMRIYRRLRAVLGNDFSGGESLKAFLYLLSCAADRKNRGQVDLNNWNLSQDTFDIANQVRDGDWNALIEEFLGGRPLENLVPNLYLILRHAAGQLFQEAHYEAIFENPGQLLFSGFLPSPAKLGNSSKNAIGLHFTPPALARTLVEESLRLVDPSMQEIIIFDPACGSGEFLREALRQLNLRGFSKKAKIIGWDISSTACAMAKYEVGWEIGKVKFPVQMEITCQDSLYLADNWPQNANIILMNPPFVSWQGMNSTQKEIVKQILGNYAGAKPDLSHAFLYLAAKSLNDNGVLGSILPASVLDGISSEKLREHLGNELNPSLIARLGSHQLFPGALIDAAFYVAKKNHAVDTPLAFWADYRITSNSAGLRALRRARIFSAIQSLPIVGDGYSIYSNEKPLKLSEPWSPRPYSSWKLINSLKGMNVVKDLFEVRQGIRTGNNKVFLLQNEEWLLLPEAERRYFRPAIVNESIRFGFLKPKAYVFFPYGPENRIDNEEQLISLMRNYYIKFLFPNKPILENRAGIKSSQWWELTRYRTWSLDNHAKLVSTYFGDAGSFGFDEKGLFVVVEGLAWLPKGEKKLNKFETKAFFAYLALLNSKVFSQLLSATSSHVGGGQWDLSRQYVNNIPIPDFLDPNFNTELISSLSSFGISIKDGLPIDEEKREMLVMQAYHIS